MLPHKIDSDESYDLIKIKYPVGSDLADADCGANLA